MITKPVTFGFKEDENYLYFDYLIDPNEWALVYSKNKDICVIIKNGKPVDLKTLTEVEVSAYKEVLDCAIVYHHEKDDALEH